MSPSAEIRDGVLPPDSEATCSSAARRRETGAAELAAAFEYRDIVLEQLIGQGAFGRVYRARKSADSTMVAVKFLRKRFWTDRAARKHLVDESAKVRLLDHPGIVRHFGWGRTDHGALFAVMEWVDGPDLATWCERHTATLSDILKCGLAVCDAVSAAHQANVLHGDLTPSNVLYCGENRFVLTDFGFSHTVGSPRRLTAAGTPGFLAPEQLSDAFGSLSTQTDVYGTGAVLYFLLTRRPPVAEPTIPDSLARTLSSESVPPVRSIIPEVPAALDVLISTCLHKEPADRPVSVDEVRHILNHILADVMAL